jgi:hypothetical protein
MLSFKQAKFLKRGLSGLAKGAGVVAAGAIAATNFNSHLIGNYPTRALGRATFGSRQKNQMTVDQFNSKLKTKGFFGRGRMYNRVRRGTIKLQGSSTIRPFAGTAGIRGVLLPRPTLRSGGTQGVPSGY